MFTLSRWRDQHDESAVTYGEGGQKYELNEFKVFNSTLKLTEKLASSLNMKAKAGGISDVRLSLFCFKECLLSVLMAFLPTSLHRTPKS